MYISLSHAFAAIVMVSAATVAATPPSCSQQAQQDVTIALASACPYANALQGSVQAKIIILTPLENSSLAVLEQACQNPPTNATAAATDAIAAIALLQPFFNTLGK
jgi:hypothetical protein